MENRRRSLLLSLNRFISSLNQKLLITFQQKTHRARRDLLVFTANTTLQIPHTYVEMLRTHFTLTLPMQRGQQMIPSSTNPHYNYTETHITYTHRSSSRCVNLGTPPLAHATYVEEVGPKFKGFIPRKVRI